MKTSFVKKAAAVIAAQLLIAQPVCAFAEDSSSPQEAITLCGGWFEAAYAEWNTNAIGGNVTVSYAESGSDAFTQVDSQLIRGDRVDIPGLKGDTSYDLRITGDKGSSQCSVRTSSFDRTGYAHYNFQNIGAYNDDGTVKPDVTVIYVTNENKDTITYNGKVGLYNIFFSAKPKNVLFRFVGKLDVPAGTVANDGSHNDGSNMLYLQNSSNVTIEGIGDDTDLVEWGIEMKRCTSCEVRNLWLGKYPDDGISMTGNVDIRSEHIWVHNNTIEQGYNAFAGNGHVDADKAEGDGSVDMKWSNYVTVSYNEFKDCHKTSLVGGRYDQIQDYITYHHNWFNNTQSRNPRARNAHIHSFNNYFSTNGEYGICASYNSKIFSEANYFEKTNSPLYAINMGKDQFSGTIKSFGDKFVDCAPDEGLAYKIVDSRNEAPQIPNLIDGGDSYDNFDLDMYSYTTQSPDQAKATVLQYAGRMKCENSGSAEPVTEPVTDPVADPVKGDVNCDGDLSINDVVLLQKWLLAVPNTDLTDWQAADLNSDGRLNVFDLCLMKQELVSKN
ncbi:MAG: hypothetical protein J6M48_10285 [Ruminococcus sp.]|nr:hypothetical protein [Ruminococcus sp.]